MIFVLCTQARKAPLQHDAHHNKVPVQASEEESLINYPKDIAGTILLCALPSARLPLCIHVCMHVLPPLLLLLLLLLLLHCRYS